MSDPVTSLHYAPNANIINGQYAPGADGFNLADISSASELSQLPSGVKALVWLGMTDGVTAAFQSAVESFASSPQSSKVYGFYLADEPLPSATTAANLKAESDWIHANFPGAKTFIVQYNSGSDVAPQFYYTPANTDIDLFGLDPYPVQTNVPNNYDLNIIPLAVQAAETPNPSQGYAAIPEQDLVPVYQAFGGGGYATYILPTATQEQAILAEWGTVLPNPAFDYAYSWGVQSGDTALSIAPALQAVFATHNAGGVTSAPGAPTIGDSAVQNGVVNKATDTASQALSGTAAAGSTVSVYLNGSTTPAYTTQADASGDWSQTIGHLANGAYSYDATATDAAGASVPSSPLGFTVDTTPPRAPTIRDQSIHNGVVSSANDIASQALSGTAEAGSTVRVYLKGSTTPVYTATANLLGRWSVTIGMLATGSYSFTATATDAAGNVSAPSSPLSFTAIDPPAPAPSASTTVPRYDHIVVVVEENHDYSQIIGDTTDAPYINNTLVAGGTLLTNYDAITHPSEANYFALYAGSTFNISPDDPLVSEPDPTIYTTLHAAGLTFQGYVDTAGGSSYDHNPWTSFPEGQGSTPLVGTDFTNFPASGNYSSLPTVSYVTPGVNDDMHDGTIAQGDTWLSDNLNAYAQWAKANNSLLIVTWDENDGTSDGNHVATILYGAGVQAGATNATAYNHYNLLSTILASYGLTGPNNAATAAPINAFSSSGAGSLSATAQLTGATEGVALGSNTTIASFTDSNSADLASGFTATIAWGDGTSSAGAISGSQGNFTVSGGHTYADEGGEPLSVTVTRTVDKASVSASGTVAVADADALTAHATTITGTAGQALSNVTVASFTDSDTANVAGDFTATINWGDGTATSAGTVVSGGAGAFSVTGSHTYASANNDAVTVTLIDAGGASATANSTAQIGGAVSPPGSLSATAQLTGATEGVALGSNTTIASFTDSNSADLASGFTATIAWGDGTSSAGAISGSQGNFTVSGGHTYADEGGEPLSVTVTRTVDKASVSASGTVAVADADALTAHATTITGTAGQALSNVTVASFTDSDTANVAGDFTATINWGDGTATSAGTVVSGGAGAFSVTGSHTYASANNDAVTVTLIDAGGASATANSTAQIGGAVSPPGSLSATVQLTGATEGVALGSGTAIAGFTDSNSADLASGFTATIAWGDGTSSAGAISGSQGNFTVSGGHTYADEGSEPLSVTVTRTVDKASVSASGTVAVADADALTAHATTITGTAGQALSNVTVASFTDSDTANVAGDFTATINWGDGTATSAGAVVSGGAGAFSVTGSHTYASANNDAVTVTLIDAGGASATANSTAQIGGAVSPPGSLSATVQLTGATEGVALGSGTAIAGFTDSNSADLASGFTATIAWGDGTSSAGAISGSQGNFTVSGGHTYADEGSEPLSVTVTRTVDKASVSASGTVAVADDDALTAHAASITGTAGQALSNVTVASFTDSDTANVAGDFTATINWGDGTATSAGTVVSGGAGAFSVTGSHTYASANNDAVTVTLIDAGGASATANSTAQIGGAVSPPGGQPVTALHYAPNGNIVNGQYALGAGADGFNLADISSASELSELGSGVKALVWLGDTIGGATAAFQSSGESFAGSSQVYGFYLADEPLASATTAANLKAESDWIHANFPGAKTFIVEDNLGSDASPSFYYTPANTDVDLFGLDPYPVRSDNLDASGNPDYSIIPTAVSAAIDQGIPKADLVPVYQAFGNESPWVTPTAAQEQQILSTWGSVLPAPAFDYAYSWGVQSGDTALSTDPALQAVFAAHNVGGAAPPGSLAATVQLTGATEGVALGSNTTIASFTDSNSADSASGFTATIAWGDGTSSAGAISGSQGNFTVSGGHTYADEGGEPLSVTITRTADKASVSAPGTVAVADADTLTAHATTITGTAGQALSNVTVASFTDSDTANAAGDFTATINWGDGTATSAGTVVSGGAGAFSVTGSHTYAGAGSDAVAVTLTDDGGGASATANSTATISGGAGSLAATERLTGATEGVALGSNTTIASFTDSNSADSASGFTATIAWGDGTSSAGAISGSQGNFTVSGGHTYADEGGEPLSVTVTRTADKASVSASGTVAVADADTLTAHATTITGTAGQALSNVTVASFTDSDTANVAGDFTATINWGDGTATSAGTVVSGGAGAFSVTGSHTYASANNDAVAITLADDGGGASATANSTAQIGSGEGGAGGTTISTAVAGQIDMAASDNPMTIANTGVVTSTASSADGIDGLYNAPTTVTDLGRVDATGGGWGAGIWLPDGGTVTLGKGGEISAPYGVEVSGGTGTIISGGTITGSQDAVLFNNSGVDRLVVNPTAVFNGDVEGGSGANTLELAGGTGSITGLSGGSGTISENGTWSFSSFDALTVDSGGAWTINGGDVPQLANAGTVIVAGALDVSSAIDPSSTGLFELDGGTTFDVAAAVGSGAKMAFLGSSSSPAELAIDDYASFGSNIGPNYTGALLEDFTTGDKIDLKLFDAAGAMLLYDPSSGILQLSNSESQHASLLFQNSTLGSGAFSMASDGGSGLLIEHK